MGENGLAAIPTAVYGFVLLMAAIAYYILERAIIANEGRDSFVARAVGRDWKGRLSLCFISPLSHSRLLVHGLPAGLYVFVALLWLIPDPRIERKLENRKE